MDGDGTEVVKSFSLLNFKIPLAWRCGLCFALLFSFFYIKWAIITLTPQPSGIYQAPMPCLEASPHVYLPSLLSPSLCLFLSLSLPPPFKIFS